MRLMLRPVHALVLSGTVEASTAFSTLQHRDQRTSVEVALLR